MEEEIKQQKPNLFLMIIKPIENFKRIRNSPQWIIPLIIIVLLGMITAVAVLKMFVSGMFIDEGLGMIIEGDPEFADSFAREIYLFSVFIAIFITFFSIPVVLLLKALIYFAIGKIPNSDATFMHYFSLAVHVTIIGTLGGIIHLMYNTFYPSMDPQFTLTSLQTIFQVDGPMQVVYTSINVFSIWELIVMAIGLQIVGNYSKKLAWTTVIVMFVLSNGISLVSFMINDFSTSLL